MLPRASAASLRLLTYESSWIVGCAAVVSVNREHEISNPSAALGLAQAKKDIAARWDEREPATDTPRRLNEHGGRRKSASSGVSVVVAGADRDIKLVREDGVRGELLNICKYTRDRQDIESLRLS